MYIALVVTFDRIGDGDTVGVGLELVEGCIVLGIGQGQEGHRRTGPAAFLGQGIAVGITHTAAADGVQQAGAEIELEGADVLVEFCGQSDGDGVEFVVNHIDGLGLGQGILPQGRVVIDIFLVVDEAAGETDIAPHGQILTDTVLEHKSGERFLAEDEHLLGVGAKLSVHIDRISVNLCAL